MRKEVWWLALLLITLLGAMAVTGRLEQPPALRSQSARGEFDTVDWNGTAIAEETGR